MYWQPGQYNSTKTRQEFWNVHTPSTLYPFSFLTVSLVFFVFIVPQLSAQLFSAFGPVLVTVSIVPLLSFLCLSPWDSVFLSNALNNLYRHNQTGVSICLFFKCELSSGFNNKIMGDAFICAFPLQKSTEDRSDHNHRKPKRVVCGVHLKIEKGGNIFIYICVIARNKSCLLIVSCLINFRSILHRSLTQSLDSVAAYMSL